MSVGRRRGSLPRNRIRSGVDSDAPCSCEGQMGFQRAHRELLRVGRWFLLVNALTLWSSAVLAQDANSPNTDAASPDPPKTQQIAERDPQNIFLDSDTSSTGVSRQFNI